MLAQPHLIEAEPLGQQRLLGGLRKEIAERPRRRMERHHEQAEAHGFVSIRHDGMLAADHKVECDLRNDELSTNGFPPHRYRRGTRMATEGEVEKIARPMCESMQRLGMQIAAMPRDEREAAFEECARVLRE